MLEVHTARGESEALPAEETSRPVLARVGRPAPFAPSLVPGCPGWYLPCRRFTEILLASVLLLLTAPFLLLAIVAVKLTSRGPGFYSQTRMGLHGRLFTIYKIRTMIHDCESLTGPRWSMPGDPRITFIGGWLRRTHLDELPQLWNVLCGHMSLVGPRPERPEFLPQLERACPDYRDRLAVPPGVTGLAQVQLPADSDLHSVRRKLLYDLFYINHVGPWLDVRILACTCLYALSIPFQVGSRLCGVPSAEAIEPTVDVRVPQMRRMSA